MSNPLYDAMSGNRTQPGQAPFQALSEIKANPARFLANYGITLPAGIDPSDPQAIISSLIQSGRISRGAYQQALRMIRR